MAPEHFAVVGDTLEDPLPTGVIWYIVGVEFLVAERLAEASLVVLGPISWVQGLVLALDLLEVGGLVLVALWVNAEPHDGFQLVNAECRILGHGFG